MDSSNLDGRRPVLVVACSEENWPAQVKMSLGNPPPTSQNTLTRPNHCTASGGRAMRACAYAWCACELYVCTGHACCAYAQTAWKRGRTWLRQTTNDAGRRESLVGSSSRLPAPCSAAMALQKSGIATGQANDAVGRPVSGANLPSLARRPPSGHSRQRRLHVVADLRQFDWPSLC